MSKEYIFCGAMTIDGSPVNVSFRTNSAKAANLKCQRDESDDGYWKFVQQSDVNFRWHDCNVYVWEEFKNADS